MPLRTISTAPDGITRDSVAAPMGRYPVTGKVALVTDGMRSVGLETVKLLHAHGANAAGTT
jgi:hypothetical protein